MTAALALEITRWIDHRPLAIVEKPCSAPACGTHWAKMAFLASLDAAEGIMPFCSFVFGSLSRPEIGALMQLIGTETEPQNGAQRPES